VPCDGCGEALPVVAEEALTRRLLKLDRAARDGWPQGLPHTPLARAFEPPAVGGGGRPWVVCPGCGIALFCSRECMAAARAAPAGCHLASACRRAREAAAPPSMQPTPPPPSHALRPGLRRGGGGGGAAVAEGARPLVQTPGCGPGAARHADSLFYDSWGNAPPAPSPASRRAARRAAHGALPETAPVGMFDEDDCETMLLLTGPE
jgi:hypothetical protein